MTRLTADRYERLADLLREYLPRTPGAGPVPGADAFRRRVQQSLVSVGAFMELARQRPDSPVIDSERSRVEALWDVLEEAAAAHSDASAATAPPAPKGLR